MKLQSHSGRISIVATCILAVVCIAGTARADDAAPAAAAPAAAAPAPAPAATPAAASAAAGAAPAPAAAPADPNAPLYKVVDGNNVDANTFAGWKTWRTMACERCHGPNQEGMVGPSLVKDLKVLTKQQFMDCVLKGRVDKGMPNFGGVETVVKNIDNLYAFLKGRSDGAIATGHLHKLPD